MLSMSFWNTSFLRIFDDESQAFIERLAFY